VRDDALSATLRATGQRLTRPRAVVARLVSERDGPFTTGELVGAARAQGGRVGRATVFRTLELFERLGLLERLDLPVGGHAYVRCRPAHHHHLLCSRCGRSTEIPDLGLATVTAEVGRRTGFRVDAHRLELFGLCPDCLLAIGDGDAGRD
jgi:Fur family ferric uptake transcriptional regulator